MYLRFCWWYDIMFSHNSANERKSSTTFRRICHMAARGGGDVGSLMIARLLTQQRQSVSPCKLSEQNFENFTIRGRFSKKKRKNCLQNFQVLRLQAAITTQRLQIARNSLPNWPSTGCLVSILPLETVRISSKSFPWDVRSAQERYVPKFWATFDVRYCVLKPLVRCSAGAA